MLQSLISRISAQIRRSRFYLLLGFGMSFLVLVNQVHAAETILLQDRDLKLSIPLTELRSFLSDQATSPTLQQFLQNASENPAEVKQWLTTQIKLPELKSEISPFILLQFNKILGDRLGRENLAALKIAVTQSISDRAFSILEILENYRSPQMRLDLNRLGQVYTDVNQLLTRIEPVLNTAEALLSEILCDCDGAAQTSELNSQPARLQPAAYQQAQAAVKSLLPESPLPESRLPESLQPPAESVLVALRTSDDPALANKRLVIQFGPFGRSIALKDLTYFAETGELSRGWRSMFNLGGVDPETVRTALTQEINADLLFLDRTLNGLLGEFLLYKVGQVLHTPSDTANIQALRSAMIASVVKDNRLSLLEVLQYYPTQQVHLDAAQLARLGSNVGRFQARLQTRVETARGGIRAAVLGVEDWLVQLQASAAERICNCDQPSQSTAAPLMVAPTIAADRVAEFLPPNWQPVSAHREDHGIIKLVWLQGTPYEMGYQHGQYLHDEIASLGPKVIGALRFAGRGLGLGPLAARRSFPEIVEECRGLADATQDIGMTHEACLVLAYGDVYQEIFANTLPNVLFWDGCAQWVATGQATKDGRLYHGSTLDNDKKPIDYIMNNPVVFIRQPNDGLPHVFLTYPGVVWPNWGLNVAGITLGLDTAHPRPEELSFQGGSNVQIMGQILKTATSFAEARQIMETQPRVHADLLMITDGKSKEAGVFEFTGRNLGLRPLQDNDVLYMTNHMVLDEMFNRQPTPVSQSSLNRLKRFSQLMEPDGIDSKYGQIDPAAMAAIGRDRVHPDTLVPAPLDVFDDDASPGGNGSLRQGLYDPDQLLLWVAAGAPPVPENPFVCFSIGELLNFPNAVPCTSPAL